MYAHNSADFTQEMFEEFLEGSLEWIAEAQSQLIHIESGKDFDPEITVDMLFRQLHTLKGTAPFFGLLQAKNLAHSLENLLVKIRDDGLEFSKEITSVLISGLTVLFETCEESCDEGKEVCDLEKLKVVLDDLSEIIHPRADANSEIAQLVKIIDPFVNHVITSGNREVLNLIQFSTLSSSADTLMAITQDPLTHLNNFAKSLAEFKAALPEGFSIQEDLETVEKSLELLLHPKSVQKRGFRVTGQYYYGDICVSPELSITYDVISAPISKINKGTFDRVNEALVQLSQKIEGEALTVCQQMADLVFLLVSGIENYSEEVQSELNDLLQNLLVHIEIREDDGDGDGDGDEASDDNQNNKTKAPETKSDRNSEKKVSGNIKVQRKDMERFVEMVGALSESMNIEALVSPECFSNSHEQDTFENAALLRRQLSQLLCTPLDELTKKIPGLARSVCDSLAQIGVVKKIKVSVDCKDISVSEDIFHLLEAPMTHIIRNACDHGIESCAERVANGKPEEGNITIMADCQHDRVRLMIQDDGAGINVEKVKEKALSKGLIGPREVATISDDDAVELLFLPGFSTAEKVSDISGRGVGLDVVKNDITKAGGKLFIKNMPGIGIIFIIKLPAIKNLFTDCRAVKSDHQSFLIPLENIRSTVSVVDCYVNDNDKTLTWHDKSLPFTRLGDVFCTGRSKPTSTPPWAIIIDYNDEELAIIVDYIGPKISIINQQSERRGQESGASATVIIGEESYSLLDLSQLKTL